MEIKMLISTRGRYAIRVLVDLAENEDEGYIPIKKIASRQGISPKYLEQIMALLSKNNLVIGIHGKGGGYRLKKEAEQYTVGEILRITEGALAPVSCLEPNAAACERRAECRTVGMWGELNDLINNFLDSKRISDLMRKDRTDNYII